MKITAYRSNKYEAVTEYKTDKILGTLSPDEMDDEMREMLNNGSTPLLCFTTKDRVGAEMNICIPVQFIISITD